MWLKDAEVENSYSIEMSEWENSSYPDPITGRTVYNGMSYLHPEYDAEYDITHWVGTFPSGAKVVIFND